MSYDEILFWLIVALTILFVIALVILIIQGPPTQTILLTADKPIPITITNVSQTLTQTLNTATSEQLSLLYLPNYDIDNIDFIVTQQFGDLKDVKIVLPEKFENPHGYINTSYIWALNHIIENKIPWTFIVVNKDNPLEENPLVDKINSFREFQNELPKDTKLVRMWKGTLQDEIKFNCWFTHVISYEGAQNLLEQINTHLNLDLIKILHDQPRLGFSINDTHIIGYSNIR